MRRIGALLLVLLVLGGPATPADARWSGTATGTGTAQAASLAPPTGLVANCLLTTTVKLDWSASASPWTTGYEIGRGTASGVYTWGPVVTGLTYTTPALALGTHYFTVRATSGPWRSTNAAEVSRLIVNVLGIGTCV